MLKWCNFTTFPYYGFILYSSIRKVVSFSFFCTIIVCSDWPLCRCYLFEIYLLKLTCLLLHESASACGVIVFIVYLFISFIVLSHLIILNPKPLFFLITSFAICARFCRSFSMLSCVPKFSRNYPIMYSVFIQKMDFKDLLLLFFSTLFRHIIVDKTTKWSPNSCLVLCICLTDIFY